MEKIKIGFARKIITPPLGTPMSGYFEPRYAKGIHDDLFANAVAFDDGERRAVIITLDLCGLKNQEYADRYKRIISDFCKIPVEAIILNCSHTHTGPIIGFDESSGVASNAQYDEWLGTMLRDVAALAFADMSPAELSIGSGKVDGVAFIRIFRMRDGTVQTNPRDVENVLCPISEINNTANLLKIEREGKEDILAVNFGLHADTIGGEIISADFIGVMRNTVEAAIPNTKCIFLQGAEGDVNTRDIHNLKRPDGFGSALHIGRTIAGVVLGICGKTKRISAENISFLQKKVYIPTNRENDRLEDAKEILVLYRAGRTDEIKVRQGMSPMTMAAEAIRIVRLENGPDEFEFELTALRIGELVIAALPGEPFCEIGKRIISESPFKMTMPLALTNGGEIYFPTGNIYEEGGYEATSTPIKKGADDILVNEMTELIKRI